MVEGVFADPVLDQLVEQASRNNNSVQVAAGRLLQARAIARQTDASRAPQVGLGAGVTRQRNTDTGHVPATVISAGASLSYEVDLFGKLAGASNAASLDAASREALLRSTRLLVQADVAQTYLSLRALDAERGLVRQHAAGLPQHAAPDRSALQRGRRGRAGRSPRAQRSRRHRVRCAGAGPSPRRT